VASILAVGASFQGASPSNLGFFLPLMLGLLVVAAAVAAWSFWRWKESSDIQSDLPSDVQAEDRSNAVLPLRAGSLSLSASLGAAESPSRIAPVEEPAPAPVHTPVLTHAQTPAQTPVQSKDLAAEPTKEPAREEERKPVIAPRSIVPLPSAKPSVNDFATLRTRVAPSAQASAFQRVGKAPAPPVRDEAATYAPTVPQCQDQATEANRVAPVEPHEDMWPQPRGLVTRAPEALVSSASDQHAAPQSPEILDSGQPVEQPLPASETPASDSVVEASAPSATPHPEAESSALQTSLFAPAPETAAPSALPLNAAGGEVDLAALLFEDLDLPADWEIKADSASAVPELGMPVASARETEPPAQPSRLVLEDIYHIVARPSAESSFAPSESSVVGADSESVADAPPASQTEPAPESWFSTQPEPEPASEPVTPPAQHEVADEPVSEAPMEAVAPAGSAAAFVPPAPPEPPEPVEHDEPFATAPPWPEAPSLPAAPVFAPPPSPQIPVRSKAPASPAPRATRSGYVGLGARYPQCHRLSLGIPITIRGLVCRNETLSEDTWTLTVLPNGAIINLAAVVATGEELILLNNKTAEEVGCRVVAMTNADGARKQVEVEFTQPAPRFWRITFPPADWSPSQRKRPGSKPTPSRDDVPAIIRS
jgi:hypothetical protein